MVCPRECSMCTWEKYLLLLSGGVFMSIRFDWFIVLLKSFISLLVFWRCAPHSLWDLSSLTRDRTRAQWKSCVQITDRHRIPVHPGLGGSQLPEAHSLTWGLDHTPALAFPTHFLFPLSLFLSHRPKQSLVRQSLPTANVSSVRAGFCLLFLALSLNSSWHMIGTLTLKKSSGIKDPDTWLLVVRTIWQTKPSYTPCTSGLLASSWHNISSNSDS